MISSGILCCPIFALEQYPNTPIQLINPFAHGGAGDLGSRVIAHKMAEFLERPIVTVHKPRGSGKLGAAYVAGQNQMDIPYCWGVLYLIQFTIRGSFN